ncbi:Ethylbenzene dehydrogenase [Metallosphaera yellowstonensis MK1]|uniref:Ethylbenzene dehydrogenase n=1 Tax=Metallosphaera yellowstonensis MK1 TaxID=671065 RepID=H2C4H5_9CREN|nr:Ethylbenzene dehydrogenase [Metallosphaera yellowstonensis]EHP70993.1 Ethylbenzene dehydrogenase [Metallosphaera yellowstonensis MK1]
MNGNNNVKSLLILGFVFMLVLVGVAYGADVLLNAASSASNTITAYYVPNAQINEANPGGELFWQSIPYSSIPLEPTVPVPDGISGHTTVVYVKAAWTYVDGVPYIFILMKAPVVGQASWLACPERTPSGQIWEPFGRPVPQGWWVVNVSYAQKDQAMASVYTLPNSEQLGYPPGQALTNPITIYVYNQSGRIYGQIVGAIDPEGNPLNNGNPINITSINLNYNGTPVTSLTQFLSMGLNGTTWFQDTYNLFYPEDTAGYVSLFYNSTYYYPDRFAIMWLLGGVPSTWTQVAYTPHMMPGTSGALSAGQAEIWFLNSNPRANNTQDSGYPGPTFFSRTSPPPYVHHPQYNDPLNLGYLPNQGLIADLFVNGSSIYYIGGNYQASFPSIDNPHITPWQVANGMANLSQLWDPSVVATGFQFVNTPTGQYMIAEFARTFSTVGVSGGQGESHYQIQLQPGQTYHVAFAVFQGGAGESVDFKSISFWWNLYIQPANSGSTFLPLFLLGNAFTAPMIAFMLMNNNSLVRFSSKLGPVIRILRQIGNVSHTRS